MKTNILILLIIVLQIKQSDSRYFTIKNRRFYDPYGSQITFHGINLVKKQFPYYFTNFNDSDLQIIKNWGLNGLRIGIMWAGVQPSQGNYNETYLQIMQQLINKAGKQYGIYTLIQFHQDLFSQVFCGDGVPKWAIPQQLLNNFGKPTFTQTPIYDNTLNTTNFKPLNNYCGKQTWQNWYFTKSVNQAFRSLYTNQNNLLDKFIKYWKKVVQKFKNNNYIIGYQLINQPWPGNMYIQPYVMIPGVSQIIHLQQIYDKITIQIRKIDIQQNICIQPITWSNGIPVGFTHAPGGQQYENRSMLCFHYYKPPIINMDVFLYARLLDMKRLNMGGLLTQYWIQSNYGDQTMDIIDKCNNSSLSLSWFVWHYGPLTSPWIIKRTYVQLLAGKKQIQYYNNITKQYKLQYKSYKQNNQHCKSIIFFNTDHYLYDNNSNIQYNMSYTQNITKLINNINISQLNMEITMYPKLSYQIKQKKYIIIDGCKLENNRIVIIKIKRKILNVIQNKQSIQNKQNNIFTKIQQTKNINNINEKHQEIKKYRHKLQKIN